MPKYLSEKFLAIGGHGLSGHNHRCVLLEWSTSMKREKGLRQKVDSALKKEGRNWAETQYERKKKKEEEIPGRI